MGLFNITTTHSNLPPTDSDSFKYCKRCAKTLLITEFYTNTFYCKRCHKINSALSKNKTIIYTAIQFWKEQRKEELFRGELGLFNPNSTYYCWMMPLFFAPIHEKQWHIYLYAFYLTEPESTLHTVSSNKKRAEKALCKESILTSEEILLLEKKLYREKDIIDNNNIYDLSIPYITQFYKKVGPRVKRIIAIFTRSKVCTSCNERKWTHEDAHNPMSTYMFLTQSPKKMKVKKFHFDRSYSKRDGWDNVCRRCKDLAIPASHPDGLTNKILAESRAEDAVYDSQADIENDRKEYEAYKKNPFKEINEQRKKDKLERIDLEDDPSYIHEYNSVNDYAATEPDEPENPPSTTKELPAPAIHIDEEIFPESP